MPEPQSDLAQFTQLIMQRQPKYGLWSLGEIKRFARYWEVRFLLKRRAIVEKYAIEIVACPMLFFEMRQS